MTEREKMRQGLWFQAGDKELVALRLKAKELCKALNLQGPTPLKAHQEKAKQLFGQVKRCYIEPNFYCDYGFNISLGDYFYANHNCVLLDAAPITIGQNVLLGPGVQIYTVNHPMDAAARKNGLEQGKPVTIGDSVWVGGGAIILPGVNIGEGAVVAAGAVVTKDVAPFTVVAGSPAKFLRAIEPEIPL